MSRLPRLDPSVRVVVFCFLLIVIVGIRTCLPVNAQSSTVGQWSSVQTWPYRGIHTQMLPTGKVIFWDSYLNADNPQLWDPTTASITPATQSGYNIFCTGFSFLSDGRLFVTGGHISDNVGLSYASIYSPFTNTWTRVADMNTGRWYPTNTTLANGDVLVVSGMVDTTVGMNLLPQIWQTGIGTWRNLTSAQLQLPYYPYMFLAPNGKIFNAGPNQATRYLDTSGSGAWTVVGNNNYGTRNWGSAVMYDNGKVLIVGGIRGDFYGSPSAVAPTATAEAIDLNAASPSWQSVASMTYPRKHHNLTLLPDGKVLVTGGSSGSEDTNSNSGSPAYAAEMWDPATNTWTTLASNSIYRGYHATALLLPDGRVLSAGGDFGGASAEVFSPPYMFKGARPTITSAPTSVSYGQTFFVGTPVGASITKATWIRLSSVTHTNNMDQRINSLSFSQAAGGLNVTAPSSSNLCPPGYYMLFILNGTGVPSVAKIVRIENTPPAAPSSLTASAVSSSQINLSWTDNSSNEGGFRVERCQGASCTNFTQIATVGSNVTSYSNTGRTASTTYRYRVRATNGGGNSGYSNTASATTSAATSSPAAPSNLTATAASSSQINLAWTDNANNETGFKIERSPNGSTWALITTTAANAIAYSDTGLTASTLYYYRARATNSSGDSANSNTVTTTTTSGGTGGPFTDDFNDNARSGNWVLGMVAAANNYDPATTVAEANQRLEITPRVNASENSYNGYLTASSLNFTGLQAQVRLVQAASGAAAESVLTVGIDGNNRYVIGVMGSDLLYTNVVNGARTDTSQAYNAATHRYLRIRHDTNNDTINFETSSDGIAWTTRHILARNFAISGIKVDLVAGTYQQVAAPGVTIFDDFRLEPAASGSVPAAPSNLTATAASTTQINLTWTDNANNEDGFRIERCQGAGCTNFTEIATVGANVTSYSNTGLTAATTYQYRVRAYNTAGNSAYSNTASATTTVTLPAAPSSLGATAASSSQINLSWADNSNNETGFRIERCQGAGCTNFTEIATVGANVTSYSNTGLTAATTYQYRVRAYNTAGNSAYSNTASATTTVTLPAAPSSLTATAASSSQINLSWADNSNNETGFKIERCQGTGCTNFAQITTVGAGVTSYANTGLTAATTYQYRVRAYNTGGDSGYSNTSSATTLPSLPVAPSSLTATAASSTQINLSWTDNANNEDGFRIERCQGAGCTNFTEIATVGANVVSYSNTGLTAPTTYQYRVRAYNTGGDSGYSNTASATTTATAPAAPSSLTATAASSTQNNLSWTDNSNNEDGFRIERCQGAGCTNFVEIATVGPGVTSYNNTGLVASTTYRYQVRAFNAGGNSPYSNISQATTQPPAPAAPSSLTATAASSTQINLSWVDNSTNEDGFRIERCQDVGCSNYAEIVTVGANVVSYSNTGLTAATTYQYRVRAYNGGGNSAYSNSANATTTTTAPQPPAAPTSLTATAASSTQINLAWIDNSNNEAGFRIERSPDDLVFIEIATVGANVATYSDNLLPVPITYYYRVRAYNDGGNSAFSNSASATTTATAPAAPSSLTATAISATQINLAWEDASTNEDGFRVERCQNAGCSNFVEIATVGAGVTSYNNTGLVASTTYRYQVRAFDAGGNSPYSNISQATTQPPAAPAAPSGLAATAISSTQINLAWADNSNNEDGFRIERCQDAGCTTFVEVGQVGAGVTSYNSTGLVASTTYRYQVRAFNAGGNSSYSNISQATTQPPATPAAPSGLTATAISSTQINLAWADNSNNEDGFRIERCQDAGCTTFVEVGQVGAGVTSYNNTGLVASTTYRYQVRAFNAGGNSPYSNISQATTQPPAAPAAPSGLTATAISSTEIGLTWVDNSTNEDGFRIERCQGAGCTNFAEIVTVGANVVSYSNTGLTAATTYQYRVRAYNGGGNSAYSNSASATTTATAPAVPSSLTATAISSTQINLAWADNSTNEDGFRIERCQGVGCTNFAEIVTVGANVVSYSNTGLTTATTYQYRVRAYNSGGNSAYSNTATATTSQSAPTVPSSLKATAASSSRINLSWADNSTNEDGFKIERCQGNPGCKNYALIFTTGTNVTTYSDTGLAASTMYTYRVRAYNSSGDSAYSNKGTATTLATSPPPAAPSNLTAAAASSSQINLAWTANSTNEEGFRIERCQDAGCTSFVEIATVGAGVTSYNSTGLVASTTYRYQVRAFNAGGNSSYSNISQATTQPPATPAAPSGLTATAISSTQINLAWADNSNNEDGFRIERCQDAGCTTFVEVGQVGAGVTSYNNTGLVASTTYRYQVRAFNAGGNSPYSNISQATTQPPAAPAAPSGLTATASSSTQINLAWADNSTNEDGFRIERCQGAGCTSFVEIATVGANVESYSNTGLTAATTYQYRVRAYNGGGNSAYSNSASATTTATAPAVPSSLTATAASSTQINLAWVDNSTNEDGFRIERCQDAGCTSFVEIATVGAGVTSYNNTGLVASTTYQYRVRAYNSGGNSAYSNTASATTSATAPAAPSSLTATAASSTQINLAWTDNSTNEDGFRIERCQDAGCTSFVEIATVAANVESYSNTGLTAATTYQYRVRAYNTAGNSAYSNSASATTSATAPAAPSSLTATAISSTQIDLSWVDNSTNEDGFRIERCQDAGCSNFVEIATVAANVKSYSNTGLTAATTYQYRVRAYNTAGNSAYSNSASATTSATAPAAPSSLTATAISSTQIDLSWVDNSTNEDGFRIERCQDAGCTSFVEIATVGAGVTSYNNTGLVASTTYQYRVRAYNSGGNSAYSNTASATTSATAPAAPSSLTATAASSTQINLAWTDNSNNEDGFRIERCQDAGCTSFAEIVTVGANVVSYSNTGLTAATTYQYRVRAYNTAGNSAYSNSASATTNATAPAAPSSLTATAASSTQINLAWTDNPNNEDGFRIERCQDVGCTSFVEIATVAANVESYSNTGLTAATTYQYRVRAYNTAGNSAYSNTASATTSATAPAAPSSLTATAISSTQIDLSWVDNSTNEDGFRIERCQDVGCTSFVEIATVGANVESYSNTGLTAATTYQYQVRAYNSGGNSAYSNTASATTSATAPAVPSSLAATAISSTQINLAWADNSTNEDGFRIERCQDAGCTSFVEIATVGANVESYSNTGLTAATTYQYRVRAYNTAGNSAYSNTASATTSATAPAAPSSLTATAASSTQINLAWADNSTNEDGFRIERCQDVGCTSFVEIATVGANVESYSNTGLTAATTYQYRVRAYNTAGNSAYSNSASATTNATAPAAPSSLTATAASSTQINLAWTDNSNNEDGFRIERCQDVGCTSFVEIATVAANVESYSNTGLTAATTYQYRVRAYNTAGNSAYSNTASATTSATAPAAPSSLTATAASSTQINLAWTDSSTNEDGFRIERCQDAGCTSFVEIATVGANVESYSNTGLTAATTYQYRVRAYNTAGNSAYSNTDSATTNATAPAAPSGLAATAISFTQINLAWTDNSNNEDGFRIERCQDAGCTSFVEIASVGAGVTSYNNTGLVASTTYQYRVRAYNSGGNSAYSNTASATTSATAPAAPSSLTATAASSTQINLAWTDNSTNEDGFRIERCQDVGCTSFVEIATVGANVESYSNTGLTAATTYQYRVRAYNSGGNSAYSNTDSATTNATAPAAPSSLTATAISSTQIDLSWADNSTNEDGFRIERCQDAGCTSFVEIATVGANVESYSNTGLTAATTYQYRVRAYNTAGNSAYSNSASATTSATAPAAPSSLTATAISSTQINLAWTDNSNNEDGFRIERCQDAGCTSFVEIATVGAGVTSYNNTGLVASTTYQYRVRAYNTAGNSAYSNTASATTSATAPAAPSSLTATAISSTQIDLSWVDNSTNEDGFRIERCQDVGCTSFVEIATVGANVESYSNTGLTAATTYQYRVRAYNTAGNSAYSNSASATTNATAPAAPSGLAATAISSTQIDLSWVDNSTNEDGFRIERCQDVGCTSFVEIATVGANVESYSNTGLTAATTYQYRVRAYNTAGNSAYSNSASATTNATAPAAPSGLAATAISSTQIDLSWVDNSTNEDGFRIERCQDAGCTSFVEIATVGANVESYSNTGLTAATTYQYRVRAYNTAGNSAYSNTDSATTSATAPAAPSSLTATAASSTQINLAWTDNSNNEDGFRIERCQDVGCTSFVEIATVGANVESYSNTGLTAATTYQYRVRAHNTAGNSAYSNSASATTNATAPAAPSGLAATAISSTQINLAWVDNSNNEDGFKIERCQDVGCTSFAEIAQVGGDVTAYSDLGLSSVTTYSYRVRAYNSGGDSAYSNTDSATTLAIGALPRNGSAGDFPSASQASLEYSEKKPGTSWDGLIFMLIAGGVNLNSNRDPCWFCNRPSCVPAHNSDSNVATTRVWQRLASTQPGSGACGS